MRITLLHTPMLLLFVVCQYANAQHETVPTPPATDKVQLAVEKPTKPDGDRWVDKTMLLWVHFANRDAAIDEVWVSSAPAKP